MSSEEFIRVSEELNSDFADLQAKSPSTVTVDDLRPLHERVADMLRTPGLGDGQELIDEAERSADALEAEIRVLEEQRLSLAQASSPTSSSCSAERRAQEAYVNQTADVHAQLSLARMIFNALLSKTVEEIRDERVCAADLRFAEPNAWRIKESQLNRMIGELGVKAKQLSLPMPESTQSEVKLFNDVKRLAADVAKHVEAGSAGRRTRDAQLKVFYGECEKLTVWCRQQLANLDAMREPDHIQEYCSVLVSNYDTMSTNFSVLVERVEEYVEANHAPVCRALADVNQLWYYVLTITLERLAKTLLEIHPKSPLENEVQKYAEHPSNLTSVLKAVKTLLEGEAKLSAAAADVLEECAAVLPLVTSSSDKALVGEHKAFANRGRALREGYACLRESVLAKLTYISSPADVVMESKRRQQEFEDCVRELKQWAAAAAHGETWRDIYSKIADIKRLVREEQERLEEEEPVE